jgi:hypothetical protein
MQCIFLVAKRDIWSMSRLHDIMSGGVDIGARE